MQLLKNKHVIAAMIVTPILAIIAYFATDYIVSEKPKKAVAGSQYKLMARSNCRYQSGLCTLKNGDLELDVRIARVTGTRVEIQLESNTPLQKVLAALGPSGDDSAPVAMAGLEDSRYWKVQLDHNDLAGSALRLAVIVADATFYAETGTAFAEYETTFSRDNFQGRQDYGE